MRYYRLPSDSGPPHLVARDDGAAADLTAAAPDLETYVDLVRASRVTGSSVDDVAGRHVDAAPSVDLERLEREAVRPVVPPEVWAAGVTYQISEAARREESSMPDIYIDVYDAERPELFFKATPARTVGPNEAVGIRADSTWDVPEPELGVVLYRGEIVGFTIGNDMSSREIEGQNPLYLPQAKVYDRCCSIGPCVASPEAVEDPTDLEMTMQIVRDDEVVFDGETSTAELVRELDELVSYLTRHNAIPDLCVLLTGTALVPPDSFTLAEGDEITIAIEGIGTLANDVAVV